MYCAWLAAYCCIFVKGAGVEIGEPGQTPDPVCWAALGFKGHAAWTVWLKTHSTKKKKNVTKQTSWEKIYEYLTAGKDWPSGLWLFWGLTSHKSSFKCIIYVVLNHKMEAFRSLDHGICGLKRWFETENLGKYMPSVWEYTIMAKLRLCNGDINHHT